MFSSKNLISLCQARSYIVSNSSFKLKVNICVHASQPLSCCQCILNIGRVFVFSRSEEFFGPLFARPRDSRDGDDIQCSSPIVG